MGLAFLRGARSSQRTFPVGRLSASARRQPTLDVRGGAPNAVVAECRRDFARSLRSAQQLELPVAEHGAPALARPRMIIRGRHWFGGGPCCRLPSRLRKEPVRAVYGNSRSGSEETAMASACAASSQTMPRVRPQARVVACRGGFARSLRSIEQPELPALESGTPGLGSSKVGLP